jgi:exopolysaccharide biosynthesis polyprenyl glycosylphosphotransferase
MAPFPGAIPNKATDIRAPHGFRLSAGLGWQGKRALALLAGDLAALGSAGGLAAHLNQFYSPLPPPLILGTWLGLPGVYWILTLVVLLLFARNGLYTSASQWKNYVRSGQLVSLVYLSSLLLIYFYDPKLAPPRSLFITAWFASVGSVIGIRLLLSLILRQVDRAQTRIFLLATGERLPVLARTLQRRSHYRIVGAALASTSSTATTLQTILASGAQEVLAENLPQTELASGLYWRLRRAGITLRLLPSSLELLHRRGVPEVVAGLPTLRMEATPLGGWDYRVKRGIDWFGSFLGVIGLAPVFVAIAIAIKLSSPGPVFFRQERMGLHGRVFAMWKFRTMIVNASAMQAALEQQNEASDGVMFKLKNDPRITPIGRFLRRTSLDELPQLFNVLMGQMSLVGPRPLPLRDVERFDPWHHTRHQVLPGITGLWQISGRSAIDAFNDAARLDLYYIDHWSLNLDLEILLETIRIVLFGKGAY